MIYSILYSIIWWGNFWLEKKKKLEIFIDEIHEHMYKMIWKSDFLKDVNQEKNTGYF